MISRITIDFNAPESRSKLSNLDGWRGLLCNIVLICHIYQIILLPVYGNGTLMADIVSISSSLSVDFFIVLSGFVIGYSGQHSYNNSFSWKKYLINRISRIYPSFLIISLICIFLVWIFPYLNLGSHEIVKLPKDKLLIRETFCAFPIDFVKSFLMLPSGILNVNGPLWSLFLEWWLYISGLFTLIAVLDLRTKFLKLMILALALVPLAYLYHIFKIPGLFYIAIWYSGLVISFCTPMFQKIIISLCLVFLLLYFLFSKLNMVEMYRTDEILWGGVSFILSIIFIFSAFHLSLNKIFFRLARFSYTLYIFHFPFIVFCHALSRKIVKHDLLNSMLLCVVLFAASIYLSSLLGRLGENKARYSRLIQNLIKFVSQINALQNRQSKILTK